MTKTSSYNVNIILRSDFTCTIFMSWYLCYTPPEKILPLDIDVQRFPLTCLWLIVCCFRIIVRRHNKPMRTVVTKTMMEIRRTVVASWKCPSMWKMIELSKVGHISSPLPSGSSSSKLHILIFLPQRITL